jgi:outer membrane protein TolC
MVAGAVCCSYTVGPNYRRPAISVPDTYRGAQVDAPGKSSLGELRWWQVFEDAELQRLLKTALDRNYDVRIGASRIEQAAANLGIVRADQFPEAGASAGFNRTKSSGAAVPFLPNFTGVTNTVIAATPSVSWALDFWGQYRQRVKRHERTFWLAKQARRPCAHRLSQQSQTPISSRANLTSSWRSLTVRYKPGETRCD